MKNEGIINKIQSQFGKWLTLIRWCWGKDNRMWVNELNERTFRQMIWKSNGMLSLASIMIILHYSSVEEKKKKEWNQNSDIFCFQKIIIWCTLIRRFQNRTKKRCIFSASERVTRKKIRILTDGTCVQSPLNQEFPLWLFSNSKWVSASIAQTNPNGWMSKCTKKKQQGKMFVCGKVCSTRKILF